MLRGSEYVLVAQGNISCIALYEGDAKLARG